MSRNVLQVIQSIAPAIGIATPTAVFGSSDQTAVDLAALANEMGDRIAKAHDWQRLKRLGTITGDGTTTAFAAPLDFDRMPDRQELRTSGFSTPLTHVTDHDLWLDWTLRDITPTFAGAWTLLGGQFQFIPAPDSGTLIKFYYQSNRFARSAGTAGNSAFPYNLAFELPDSSEFGFADDEFTADEDFFQLDWKLLKLGMIWQWKANKGLPYVEDLGSFNEALEQRILDDKGPQDIRVGRATFPRGVSAAYPWTIS